MVESTVSEILLLELCHPLDQADLAGQVVQARMVDHAVQADRADQENQVLEHTADNSAYLLENPEVLMAAFLDSVEVHMLGNRVRNNHRNMDDIANIASIASVVLPVGLVLEAIDLVPLHVSARAFVDGTVSTRTKMDPVPSATAWIVRNTMLDSAYSNPLPIPLPAAIAVVLVVLDTMEYFPEPAAEEIPDIVSQY